MDRGPEFNSERLYFDKWEMHRLLTAAKKVTSLCHVPAAELWQPGVVTRMLERYGTVYIKPVDTWGGTWITRIEKTPTGYTRRMHPNVAADLRYEDLEEDIASIYDGRRCIVQQCAPALTYGDHALDIRVHMQRDEHEAWVFAGALVRVAGDHGVVSNVALSGGQVLPVDAVMSTLFGQRKLRAAAVTSTVPIVGREICKALDRYHEFEEVGADFGVDARGGLWLYEVNTDDAFGRPSRELFSRLPSTEPYEAMQKRAEARDMATLQAVARALFGDTWDSRS